MKKYIHKGAFTNLCYVIIGVTLFFFSFHIGESTFIGGVMHLSGCALSCAGFHRRWCKDTCEENKCC